MFNVDPSSPVNSPIRRVYQFDLTLGDKFLEDCLRVTQAENEHLRAIIPLGKKWPVVRVRMEDWRSHLTIKVEEQSPLSFLDSIRDKIAVATEVTAPDFERRSREESVDVCDFYGQFDLWRRMLSPTGFEYLTLEIIDTWTLRLAAMDGRFESFGFPFYDGPAQPQDEFVFLALRLTDRELGPFLTEEPELGMVNSDWRRHYKGAAAIGVTWELTVTDIQRYLEGVR